ncbi:hypothetical protein ABPG74_020862 [Tetrahymena malaccensis]
MSSWWKWIAEFWNSESIPKENLHTITFDGTARHCQSNILSTRIHDHGGGMTAIPEAFKMFETVLDSIPVNESVTAIFISDGQDNNLNTLEERMKKLKGNHENRKINFICLGIQSGFPTFLSMRLRQLYHQGDENIPALYLIEYVSEKAFFNKFEGMKNYFYSAGAINIDPPVMIYPWDETVIASAYEGSWVIVKGDELTLDDSETIKIEKTELSVEDAVEIFRGWIQKLQILSLNDPALAKSSAVIAVREMQIVIDQLNKTYGLEDVRQVTEELINATPNFGLRAKYNFIWRYGSKIGWFFTEVDNLAKGVSAKQSSEFEAAKRMNIGTITGKHQQKALALKNITQQEFNKIKEEFIATLQTQKKHAAEQLSLLESLKEKSLKPYEEGAISIAKMLANVDDFIQGLNYCKNQYDLCETLPLQGLACKVKRNEGFESNPRLIDFKNIYINNQLDVSALTNQFWNIPTDINGDKVELNAILPLFRREQAAFLRPLLRTRLMKFINTYLLTCNFDLLEEDAYLNALSSALIVAYQPQNLSIRSAITDLIFESLEVYYDEDKRFQNVQDELSADPNKVVLDYKDKIDELFLYIFFAQRSKRIDSDQLEDVMNKVKVLFFSSAVTKHGLYSIIKPDFESIGMDAVEEELKKQVNSFFSLSDFRKGFSSCFTDFAKKAASQKLHISKKLIYDDEISKVPLRLIEALLEDYQKSKIQVTQMEVEKSSSSGKMMEEPKDGEESAERKALYMDYIYLASHVQKYPLNEAFSNPVEKDIDTIKQQVIASVDEASIKKIKGFNELFSKVEEHYVKVFIEQHWNVQPINKEQLIKYCEEKGVVFDTLQFDEASLLCKNACMSPLCPFFLKTSEKFNRHLGGWQGKLPLGFHRFVKARANQTVDKLYQQATTKWKGFPAKFNVTPEFAKDYISKTLSSYVAK